MIVIGDRTMLTPIRNHELYMLMTIFETFFVGRTDIIAFPIKKICHR